MQSRVHRCFTVILTIVIAPSLGLGIRSVEAQATTSVSSSKSASKPQVVAKAPAKRSKIKQVGLFGLGSGQRARRSYRSRSYTPRHLHDGHAHAVSVLDEDTNSFEVIEGEPVLEDPDAMFEFEDGAEIVIDDDLHRFHDPEEGVPCTVCGEHNCRIHWICLPIPLLMPENASFFTGVHGSKAAPNRGEGGSFGFEQGFNLGSQARLVPRSGIGHQFGMRAVQSDFSGSDFTNDTRHQIFATYGLFHRVDEGFQAGAAFDYLHDDWDYQMTMTQFRGEVSWLKPDHHEWGFSVATSARNDTFGTQIGTTRDLYTMFYRYRLDNCGGGEARFRAGGTDEGEAVVGANIKLPISDRWALATEFVYLIPKDGASSGGSQNEIWNVGINLVWYPRRSARSQSTSYYRPLFDVAGNNSMLIGGQF